MWESMDATCKRRRTVVIPLEADAGTGPKPNANRFGLIAPTLPVIWNPTDLVVASEQGIIIALAL